VRCLKRQAGPEQRWQAQQNWKTNPAWPARPAARLVRSAWASVTVLTERAMAPVCETWQARAKFLYALVKSPPVTDSLEPEAISPPGQPERPFTKRFRPGLKARRTREPGPGRGNYARRVAGVHPLRPISTGSDSQAANPWKALRCPCTDACGGRGRLVMEPAEERPAHSHWVRDCRQRPSAAPGWGFGIWTHRLIARRPASTANDRRDRGA